MSSDRWSDVERETPRPYKWSEPWPLALRDRVVENDPWKTFQNLLANHRGLDEKRLPRLEELGETEREFDDDGRLSFESRVRESSEPHVVLAGMIASVGREVRGIAGWATALWKLFGAGLAVWAIGSGISWLLKQ